MKITKTRLKQIIKEEIKVIAENPTIPTASESIDNEVFSLKRAVEKSKRVEDAKASGDPKQLVKSIRRAIQSALWMDEALPGEDDWLEMELKLALEHGKELDSVLRAYLQKWRGRK